MQQYPSTERGGEQPLFERLDRDNATQLQSALATIEALQQQVATLERINVDLESRLERQARERIEVEHECAEIDRKWREKYNKLEKSMDQLRMQIHKQQQQNERLREHLRRTERELHGILQRKYEFKRTQQQQQPGGGGGGGAAGSSQSQGGGGGGGILRRGWRFSRDSRKSAAAAAAGAGGADADVAPLAQKASPSNRRPGTPEEEEGGSSNSRLSDLDVEDDLSSDMGYAGKSSTAHEVRQSRAFASLSDFFGL